MTNCIIVTSVVQTTDKPVYHSALRSIYSHQERFQQTLETIESIRKYMPDIHIFLIECSPPSDWMDQLATKVDQFINLEFNDTVNNHPEKGLGEKILILHALDNLKETYQHIYKITGRYVLQDTFDFSKWKNEDSMTFCNTLHYGIADLVHTFFYSIKLPLYREILESYQAEGGCCIEFFVAEKLKNKMVLIDHIGILARWSCYDKISIY